MNNPFVGYSIPKKEIIDNILFEYSGYERCEKLYEAGYEAGVNKVAVEESIKRHNQSVERFWSKVNKTETCWIWIATLRENGYGQFKVSNGHTKKAHRIAYELIKGEIPENLYLDHLCRNRACVNPDHLEPVTPAENNRRSLSMSTVNAKKTECIRGHEFSQENTLMRKGKYGMQRKCKTCTYAKSI